MLDIILIQHAKSGINLLEYQQETTKFNVEHSDIFAGFLSAIQNITRELDIGVVVLISTKGSRGHNCIIVPKPPINVIILADQDDPVEVWREQGEEIADKFIEKFGESFEYSTINKFQEFLPVIKEKCTHHPYCD